jgi:hypothetical protein
VRIGVIREGKSADRAGLKEGDVITHIGAVEGKPVKSAEGFKKLIVGMFYTIILIGRTLNSDGVAMLMCSHGFMSLNGIEYKPLDFVPLRVMRRGAPMYYRLQMGNAQMPQDQVRSF